MSHQDNETQDGAALTNFFAQLYGHAKKPFNEVEGKKYMEAYEKDTYDTTRPVTVIIVGAGNRGKVYSEYAIERPGRCKVRVLHNLPRSTTPR